jgi:hypothetical protein
VKPGAGALPDTTRQPIATNGGKALPLSELSEFQILGPQALCCGVNREGNAIAGLQL